MTPTPRELAMAAYQEWADVPGARNHADFLRVVSNAIASAITDQTAALQAALEDLAKVKHERDGLAAVLAESKKHAKAAKVFAHQVAGSPRTSIGESDGFDDLVLSLEKWSIGISVQAILAAHDRQVAARVLREIAPFLEDQARLYVIAAEYESGEREVPNA